MATIAAAVACFAVPWTSEPAEAASPPGAWPALTSAFSSVGRVANGHTPASSALPAGRKRRVVAAYGKLPLSFERNQGQAAQGVRFLSRGAGYALALTDRGPQLSLAGPRRNRGGGTRAAEMLATTFVGGRRRAPVVGSGRLGGRVNYLVGKDSSRWHTGVPTYSRVAYRRVWKGIDVAFHGNQSRLEYDYRVAPGADPHQIGVRFSGARRLRLDRGGNLVVGVRHGSVRELAPRAYQTVGGVRRPVASRYVIGPGHQVAVRVGVYDHHKPLVIDPTLAYSTYLANIGSQPGLGIAVDTAGDLYLTGGTTSTSFPATPGSFQSTNGGGDDDAFVLKLNPTGTGLVYATYLGGTKSDYGAALALDTAGDAYVTGTTDSADFPTTPGAFRRGNPVTSGFVAKLSPTGSALAYSTFVGGVNIAIAVDGAGSAYVTGNDSAESPTPGAFQTIGLADYGFVTKLNPAGSALVYSTYLSGSDDGTTGGCGPALGIGGKGIAVDSAGDAYVTGDTNASDFPTTAGAPQRTLNGGASSAHVDAIGCSGTMNKEDAFVSKLNPAGTGLVYSTLLGGSGGDVGTGIALGPAGSAYVTGDGAAGFPTTAGAFRTTAPSGDGFVTEVNSTGSALTYSTFLGGGSVGGDVGLGNMQVAVDLAGRAYVAGQTGSATFPTTPDAFDSTFNGGAGGDGFLEVLAPTGSALAYSTYLGGTGLDRSQGVARDPAGGIYVAGNTNSTDFPTTTGAFQTTNPGGADDLFVTKFGVRSTSTAVACSPASVTVGQATSCTVTVTDTASGTKTTPAGTVDFSSSGDRSFSGGTSCFLSGSGASTSCELSYTPTAAGNRAVTGAYEGTTTHGPSTGTAAVDASAPLGTSGISQETGAAGTPSAPAKGANPYAGCVNARGGIQGKRLGVAFLGRSRTSQRRVIKGTLRSRRGGIDRYCVTGGGALRIGYPTARLLRARSLRSRVKKRQGKALLALTSSKRFTSHRLRVGDTTSTLRKRLHHARHIRVGRNTWYLAAGQGNRLLFQVRDGHIRQLGIADKSLTRSRTQARSFLRGWQL
jgi:Beta-propeller repeat